MAESGFDLQEIARLIALVEERDLLELIYEEDDRRIVIRGAWYGEHRRGGRRASSTASPPQTDAIPHRPSVEDGGPSTVAEAAPRTAVIAPMVGVFYRAPAQDAPPYVEVGDRIEVGQTIGLIEAMKVFSEVPSDHAGTVIEVHAHSGQLVRSGEPLIYLTED